MMQIDKPLNTFVSINRKSRVLRHRLVIIFASERAELMNPKIWNGIGTFVPFLSRFCPETFHGLFSMNKLQFCSDYVGIWLVYGHCVEKV